MRQHQVRSDLTFHVVKSSSACISPVPSGVVLQQSVERVQRCRQIRQESIIIVHQTKKTSKLADIGWLWSVADRVHLGQLVQSVSADCMAAVFGLGIEESRLRYARSPASRRRCSTISRLRKCSSSVSPVTKMSSRMH